MKRIIFIMLICTSCYKEDREDINCKYQGAIIYQVHLPSNFGHPVYDIKYKGEIIPFVDAYDIDNGYKLGDTINKPCLK